MYYYVEESQIFLLFLDGKVKASREVILSAGTIVSPQLLLLSGIGDKSDLAQLGIPLITHLPGVGHNLQDHVASYGLTWTTKGSGNAYNPFLYTIDPRTYLNWKLSRTGKSTIETRMLSSNWLKKAIDFQFILF